MDKKIKCCDYCENPIRGKMSEVTIGKQTNKEVCEICHESIFNFIQNLRPGKLALVSTRKKVRENIKRNAVLAKDKKPGAGGHRGTYRKSTNPDPDKKRSPVRFSEKSKQSVRDCLGISPKPLSEFAKETGLSIYVCREILTVLVGEGVAKRYHGRPTTWSLKAKQKAPTEVPSGKFGEVFCAARGRVVPATECHYNELNDSCNACSYERKHSH